MVSGGLGKEKEGRGCSRSVFETILLCCDGGFSGFQRVLDLDVADRSFLVFRGEEDGVWGWGWM
jgi:hypothetical protein